MLRWVEGKVAGGRGVGRGGEDQGEGCIGEGERGMVKRSGGVTRHGLAESLGRQKGPG